MSQDLYATLGVPRTASDAEIKKAYRTLAKELHPDKNPNDARIADRFKSVSAAYALLSDPEKRKQYDRGEINAEGQSQYGFGGPGGAGPRPGAGGFTADAADLFAEMFAGRGARARTGSGFGFEDLFTAGTQQQPGRGADLVYKLEIPFTDAALAKEQRLTLQNGRTIDLKIPRGVTSGQQLKLAGQGKAGPGGAGDALITLQIQPHAFFERDGDDILADLPISLAEAVKGAKVRAPTPEGAVMVSVPPNCSSGKVLRVRGKGFTRPDGSRGDLLLRLEIAIPAGDVALRAFIDSWANGDAFDPRKAAGME